MKPPEQPKNLSEYLWYCRYYEKQIYFRVQRNGKFESLSLADLTPQEYGEKLAILIEAGRLPAHILGE